MTTDAYAFLNDTCAACADETRTWAHGRVLHTPSLPLVYSVNGVVVSSGTPSAEEVLAEMPPGVPRPSVMVEGEERYTALAGAFAGWEVETELVMLLDRPPEAPDPGAVREGTLDEIDALADRWFVEDFLEKEGLDAVTQLKEFGRRQRSARNTRGFVNADATAMTLLWSDGDVAQVEDVYTSPESRGMGHARALVSHVARLAADEGHRMVFIVAADDDTPKQLYERLGFRPASRARRFTQAQSEPSRRPPA
jgi:ribosomal protein S18 acetylase RimI-like enzyme